MNERIRELYEQARLHAKSIDADIDPKGWMDEYHKKFAELIVKEMCQVIDADCELQYSKGVISNLGGLNQARELIKQHFGVES